MHDALAVFRFRILMLITSQSSALPSVVVRGCPLIDFNSRPFVSIVECSV